MKRIFLGYLPLALLLIPACGSAQVPAGWEKITGSTVGYAGKPDGIEADRQNAYAWSMSECNGYLWVGTARNVLGQVAEVYGVDLNKTPNIPKPTDPFGRIYRMPLNNGPAGTWNKFHTASYVPNVPVDIGYRMMRCYSLPGTAGGTLLVGSAGWGVGSMLAVGPGDTQPLRVFTARNTVNAERIVSVRAMVQYKGETFWASDNNGKPAIWHSPNPVAEYNSKKAVYGAAASFYVGSRIDPPANWIPVEGGEVMDMIVFNDAIYVFFLTDEDPERGFLCAKLTMNGATPVWKLIVGEPWFGAKYRRGMGRDKNAGAVPMIFNGKVYVGTIEGAFFRLIAGYPAKNAAKDPLSIFGGLGGMQIFRFGTDDVWERVMPSKYLDAGSAEAQSGFNNVLNKYIWRMGVQNGRLYAGTFDSSTALQEVAGAYGVSLPAGTITNPLGFDLYSTSDGVNWRMESINGFNDGFNYGARTFLTDSQDNLYLGTANPFYGFQVWLKRAVKP